MNKLRSLRTRLVASYALLAFLLLAIAGILFSAAVVDYANRVEEQRIKDRLLQASRIASASTDPPEETGRKLQELFPEMDITSVPAIPMTAIPYIPSSPPSSLEVMPDGKPVEVRLFFTGVAPAPDGATSTVIGGSPPTKYVLTAKRQHISVVRALLPQVAGLIVSGMGLATLIGWWFSRRLSRPLAQLTDATASVANGDFPRPLDRTGTPELDRLVAQFNVMVARLNDSFRSLAAERDVARRFAADAAHELKTPLTALRAYYEIAEAKPDRAAQLLPATGKQIDRIERITSGLLRIATISEGSGMTLIDGDLRESVRSLTPAIRSLAVDCDHAFDFLDSPDALPVRYDPHLVELALANLVENACKFTPPGGRIRLSLAREGEWAMIGVEDNGVGIPAHELPHIFERFHRGIDTQEIPGSGLGLSIVREAVGRQGGTVEVKSEVGAGSHFIIRLPLVPPPLAELPWPTGEA